MPYVVKIGTHYGLRQGRMVPFSRATVYPHEHLAESAKLAYQSKCVKRKQPLPDAQVLPWSKP